MYLAKSPDIHVATHDCHTLPPQAVVAQQPVTIDPTLDLCTKYRLCLGRTSQCGTGSVTDTSTMANIGIEPQMS